MEPSGSITTTINMATTQWRAAELVDPRGTRFHAAASIGCAGRRVIMSDSTAAMMPVAPAIMKACR
jgi:hypothetical protein